MSVSLHEIRERYLECSVCFQEYDNDRKLPRFLPCNHTFCETCLGTLMLNNSIKCPQCNQEHRVEEIDNLPKDNTRRDLKDFLDESKEESIKYQRCNTCQENTPARLYCNNCDLFLCIGCFKEKHKFEGQTAHSFITIQHENILPDKFTTCAKPGHEKGLLKYFSISNALGKPVCATCILEENAEILHDKLNYCTDILKQRLVFVSKEKEQLSSLVNAIDSEISLIVFFMDELTSKSLLLHRRTEALYQTETGEIQISKRQMKGNINRAVNNDKRILETALRNLNERLSRINECFVFLDIIVEIDDALLFYELYTYISEIGNGLCQTPVESFDFNLVSFLYECSQMVDTMEKEITMKRKYKRRFKDIMTNLSTQIKSSKSRICAAILIWIILSTSILSLPGSTFRLFEADATFPDIKLVSPAFHPSLDIYENNKSMSFNSKGFRSIHGTYGNLYFGDKLSYSFTIGLSFEFFSEIGKKNELGHLFEISFSGYNVYEYERAYFNHTGIWSLNGFLCYDNSRVCIGTREGDSKYYQNVTVISLSKRTTIYKANLTFQINPEQKEIQIILDNSYSKWILSNVNFNQQLRPVFEINKDDHVKVSFKILTNWLKFDKQSVHPDCSISADMKTLDMKKPRPLNTTHFPVKSIEQVMEQSFYTGTIANVTSNTDSNIYFVIDIDYNGDPFDKSIPLFEIGFISLSSDKTGTKSIAKSVIGYYCEEFIFHFCFRPNDCLHCNKSPASNKILIHILNGFVSIYGFPRKEVISVFKINSPTVPFFGIFVPQNNIKLHIRSGNDIELFYVHDNAFYGSYRFLSIGLPFFVCYVTIVVIVSCLFANITLIRNSSCKTKKRDRVRNKRHVIHQD